MLVMLVIPAGSRQTVSPGQSRLNFLGMLSTPPLSVVNGEATAAEERSHSSVMKTKNIRSKVPLSCLIIVLYACLLFC